MTPRLAAASRRLARLPLAYLETLSALRALRRAGDAAAAFGAARGARVERRSVAPHQIESEFLRFLEIVARERPATVLEIGTATGGSIALLCRAAADDARLVTLELMRHPLGARSPLGLFCRGSARGRQRVVPLIGTDSHDPAVRAEVERQLGGRPVDVLFVDGDHSYAGVRADFELYRDLVRSGGLVAFHDIVPGPEASVGGVPRFWQEIRGAYEAQELVESWEQGGFGIGVLRMP